MNSVITLLILVSFGVAVSFPTAKFVIVTGNENPNYIDIFANETAPPCTTSDVKNITTTKNGLIDPYYRWRDFMVVLDPAFDDAEREAILTAMGPLAQTLPCVNFILADSPNKELKLAGDYIQTIKGTNNGCNSWIGRNGGRQDMNLQSPQCFSQGTIMHEMIHALGFRHEHARADRDNYVNIRLENVIHGQEHNFEKYVDGHSFFGVPYDTRSIMHYHNNEFSSNGRSTITAKNGGIVGSEGKLQNTDIQRLRNMYQC